jgi:spermidine synthase
MESVEKVKSLFHDIEVIDTQRDDLRKCLLLDNEIQFCEAESPKYHELIVHFGAQYLPNALPKRVLIVGGGDCLVLREVAKYPGVSVTVLELDDMVTRVSEKHFGASLGASRLLIANSKDDSSSAALLLAPPTSSPTQQKRDKRAAAEAAAVVPKWIYGNVAKSVDKLVASLESQEDMYDYIIVDTTETTEHNAETDTLEFFKQLSKLLVTKGVIVKNGERCKDILAQLFSYTLTYGYDSKAHESRYTFTIASIVDFKSHLVAASMWSSHNVATTSYDPDKHYEYIKWTDTFRFTNMDTTSVDLKTTKAVSGGGGGGAGTFPRDFAGPLPHGVEEERGAAAKASAAADVVEEKYERERKTDAHQANNNVPNVQDRVIELTRG